MSYERKGSMPITVLVTRDPDRRGNYVCTGAAGHEVTIQLAVDELNRQGGGLLHIARGSYSYGGIITLYDNIIVEGEGVETLFTQENGINDHCFYAYEKERIIIRDLKIDGNKANNPVDDGATTISGPHGVAMLRCSYCDVIRVEVVDYRVGGVYFQHATYSFFDRIIDCRVIDSGWDGVHNSCNHGVIQGCYVHGSSDTGIAAHGSFVTIIGNNVETLDGTTGPGMTANNVGISLQRDPNTVGHNHVVIGNTIFGCKIGVSVVHDLTAHIDIVGNTFGTISERVISCGQGDYINIVGNQGGPDLDCDVLVYLSGATNVQISDNFFDCDPAGGGSGYGVNVISSSHAVTVYNNTFINLKAIGVRDSGNSYDVQIKDNRGDGAGSDGIQVISTGDDCEIDGNTIIGYTDGIDIDDGDDVTIRNNRFRTCTNAINGDNATVVRAMIMGNNWEGCTNDPATGNMTNPRITSNLDKNGAWWGTGDDPA